MCGANSSPVLKWPKASTRSATLIAPMESISPMSPVLTQPSLLLTAAVASGSL